MNALIHALQAALPARQVITDDLRRLAYGTDASFYRLIPQVVAVIENEDQARTVLATARQHDTPVTFRAAGTSLSGQAISDGVLALIGEGFATFELADDASQVRVGPGMVGDQDQALALLAVGHGDRGVTMFGPDGPGHVFDRPAALLGRIHRRAAQECDGARRARPFPRAHGL